MTYLFIVQGEGRGHMTQSVTLAEMLEEKGHRIEAVYLGVSPQRKVPGFYSEHFGDRLSTFRSPNFIRSTDKKGIRVSLSILYNLLYGPLYLMSIFRLAGTIRRSKASTVVNFYDMIGGLAHLVSFSHKKMVIVSHHLFFERPEYTWPPGHRLMRSFLRLHTFLASLSAGTKIALSFSPVETAAGDRIRVAPPLIRQTVRLLTPEQGEYILVYLLNGGFLADLLRLASCHSSIGFHIYTDDDDHVEVTLPNITLSGLGGDDFLRDMAGCRAVICTAGFETVCESAFLGKPVMIIPSRNHFEQLCNAEDARRSGVAFKLTELDDSLPFFEPDKNSLYHFKRWCELSREIFAGIVTG